LFFGGRNSDETVKKASRRNLLSAFFSVAKRRANHKKAAFPGAFE
jgi:hypothetical protein